MIEIIPAVYPIPQNFKQFRESTSHLAGIVPIVQLDVMDGIFVENASWPYGGHEHEFNEMVKSRTMLPYADQFEYEIDLMVQEPEHVIENWMHLKVRRIIVHIESTKNMQNIMQDVAAHVTRASNQDVEVVSLGIALGSTTLVDSIEPYIHDVDFIQCMGIAEIGKQGEQFDERVLTQVSTLRTKHPELIISVDGGVNFDTAPLLISAGANRLVSGSTLGKSDDIKAAITRLQST
jgi:ribulose-phosphate 3-epimerase